MKKLFVIFIFALYAVIANANHDARSVADPNAEPFGIEISKGNCQDTLLKMMSYNKHLIYLV